jgi:hypothetical protein
MIAYRQRAAELHRKFFEGADEPRSAGRLIEPRRPQSPFPVNETPAAQAMLRCPSS